MTKNLVIGSWFVTNRRLIAVGLLFGVFLGTLLLAAIQWLPTVFETPLKAEFALHQPEKPEAVDEINNSSRALDLALGGDYPAALALIREPALQGYSTAQGVVGTLYYNGTGVPQDYPEAMRWWKLSSDQGEPAAQFMLAMGYATGRGVTRNLALTRVLTESAAQGGFPQAQYALGTDLLFGNSDDSQRERGWHWIAAAASKGHPEAQALVKKIQTQIPKEPSARDRMEAFVADAFRGPLTLNQAQMLSRLLSQNSLPQNNNAEVEPVQQHHPDGRPAYGLPLVNSPRQTKDIDTRSAIKAADRYRGLSGATYKYDLGNTYSRMQYAMDPMAQLQDSITIDPRADMDRSIGQNGGGVER